MITLHHLDHSRSIRVLWALEELGVDFELVSYERDAHLRAPPSLAAVHALGKAPVIVDGDLVLAESSAILRYINERYGEGRLAPAAGTDAHAIHDEWLDYVEGSAALPVMLGLFGKLMGDLPPALQGYAASQLQMTLRYIASGLGDKPFLMGDELTLADIQMSYMLVLVEQYQLMTDEPIVAAYLARLQQVPSYLAAVARGGPPAPSRVS